MIRIGPDHTRHGRGVGTVCRGCGRIVGDFTPSDAVALTRSLEGRFRSLLRLSDDAPLGGADPGAWSVLEYAAHVGDLLGGTDDRLCRLLGDDPSPVAVDLRIEPPVTGADGLRTLAVLACLSDNATRLVRTINGTTAEEWQRGSPRSATNAAELVWLMLHDAIHHLEDAELAVPHTFADHGPAEHRVPNSR